MELYPGRPRTRDGLEDASEWCQHDSDPDTLPPWAREAVGSVRLRACVWGRGSESECGGQLHHIRRVNTECGGQLHHIRRVNTGVSDEFVLLFFVCVHTTAHVLIWRFCCTTC